MKNNTWTIRKRLLSLFACMIILILLIGIIPFELNKFYTDKINTFSSEIIPAIKSVTLADMLHDGIRANLYGVIMARNTNNFERIKELSIESKEFNEDFLKNLNILNSLIKNKEINIKLNKVLADGKKYTELSENIIFNIMEKKNKDTKILISQFNDIFKQLEKSISNLTDDINNLADENIKITNEYSKYSLYFLIFSLIIVLFLAFILSNFIIKKLNNILNELIIGLNNQSKAILLRAINSQKSSKELSDMTIKQGEAIQETAASMEEMSSMLTQTSKHSAHNLDISEEGQKSAQKGKESMIQMLAAMDSIQSSNTKLEEISNLIVKIANKTKIINEIVSETRLLSFNASIEAARAGANGKGFAVVAEEVGKLASMSGSAANEIRELLESSTVEVANVVSDIRERIVTGKNIFKSCELVFDNMTEILFKINEGTKIIVSSTSEQETGVKQTTIAMRQIDEVTQKNTSIGVNQANDSQFLLNGIKNINDIISKLKFLIVGNTEVKQEIETVENYSHLGFENKNNFYPVEEKTVSENNEESKETVIDNLPNRNDSRWKA